jgi:hypothetical protein
MKNQIKLNKIKINTELLYGDDFYSAICEAVNKPIFINYEKSLTYINNDPNSKLTLYNEKKIDSLRELLGREFFEQSCIDSTVVDTTFGQSSSAAFKKIISQSLYNFKNGNGFGCQISLSCLAACLEKPLTKNATRTGSSSNKISGLLKKYAMAGLIELVTEGYKPEIKRKDTQYIQVNPSLLLYMLRKNKKLIVRLADHLIEIFIYRIDKKKREEGSKDAALQGFNFSVKIGSRAILANKIEDLQSTIVESKTIKNQIK